MRTESKAVSCFNECLQCMYWIMVTGRSTSTCLTLYSNEAMYRVIYWLYCSDSKCELASLKRYVIIYSLLTVRYWRVTILNKDAPVSAVHSTKEKRLLRRCALYRHCSLKSVPCADLQLAALNVVLYRIKPYTTQLCYCIAMMIWNKVHKSNWQFLSPFFWRLQY